VKKFTFKQLIQEHLLYHDNVKHDANLVILLSDKVVVAIACAERNINKSVYISSVHVNENYRGKKLCYEVMKRLIDIYPVGTRFVLGVVHDNVPAVKCYTKMGFIVTNTKVGRKHTIDTMELVKV
jgi:ribosomal protein S18 acetylase RimI-like enzyme